MVWAAVLVGLAALLVLGRVLLESVDPPPPLHPAPGGRTADEAVPPLAGTAGTAGGEHSATAPLLVGVAPAERGTAAVHAAASRGQRALRGRVVDASRTGIARASVIASGTDAERVREATELFRRQWLARTAPTALARTRTDDDGGFHLTGVPPGRVVLTVGADGHAPERRIVEVATTDNDPHELLFILEPGRVAEGRVVDAEGRAVPFLAISTSLDPLNPSQAEHLGPRILQTDAQGRFVDRAAPPGRLGGLIVHDESGLRSPVTSEEPAPPTAWVVQLPDRAWVDVVLTSTANGAPVPDADVMLMSQHSAATGRTDTHGRLRLAAEPGEIRHLAVRHPRYGLCLYSPYGRAGATHWGLRLAKEARVLHAGVQTLTLALDTSVAIQGRVIASDGQAIGHARVLVSADGWMDALMADSVRTAEDGRYTIHVPRDRLVGQPEGTAILGAEAASHARSDPFVLPHADLTGPVEAPDLVLRPLLEIRGRVVDIDGGAVPDVAMRLHQPDARADVSRPAAPKTTTDADGRYAFHDLPPWTQALYIEATDVRGRAATSLPLAPWARGAQEVADLVLGRGVTLEVRAVDAHGAPVEGAVLHLSKGPGQGPLGTAKQPVGVALTDGLGRALFEQIGEGERYLRHDHVGYLGGGMPVLLGPGPIRTLRITLVRRRILAGVVLDGEGAPAAGARIDAVWQPERSDPATTGEVASTASEGQFHLVDVPLDAAVDLTVTLDGHRPLHRHVRSGEEVPPLRFVLQRLQVASVERLAAIAIERAGLVERLGDATDADIDGQVGWLRDTVEAVRRLDEEAGRLREDG